MKLFAFSKGNQDQVIECCRCKTTLGCIHADSVVMDLSDVESSIYLYKHTVSLRFSNLFRYSIFQTFYWACFKS